MHIPDKKDILLPKLYTFFSINDNIQQMLPIVMGETKISIRLLDWFITNYAKYKRIYYLINNKTFNVHMDYKAQLKGYKKNLFDPFCRKKRIPFYYSEDKYIVTTIGQLNFFRWAITNKIIDYVFEYFDTIYIDMSKKNIETETTTATSDSIIIKNTSSENIFSDSYFEINFNS